MAFVDALGSEAPCEASTRHSVTNRSYVRPLMDALPRGPAWARDDEGLGDIVEAMAVDFSRTHGLADQMLIEMDPATTHVLLSDWEETYGLPECPGAVPSTDDLRRAVLVLKVKAQTGHEQTLEWWSSALGTLGYPLLWWESGEDVLTCIDPVTLPIAEDEWPFVSFLGVEDGADDAVIECVAENYKLGGLATFVHFVWSVGHSDTDRILGVTSSADGYAVVVGVTGLVLRAADDWTSWSTPTVPGGLSNIYGVACGGVDGDLMIAVGIATPSSHIRSFNSGGIWTAMAIAGAADLFAVTRGSANDTFVAVGDNGKIWRTVNQGAAWSGIASPTFDILLGVAHGEGDVIVAVGENGTVIRSTTDGAAFSAITAPDNPSGTTHLRAVDLYGEVGVAVGDDGYMMRSVDGGATWETIDALVSTALRGVTGSHHGRWTAVGDDGVVLQSFDNGVTWQEMDSPTAVDLYAVAEHLPSGHAIAGGDITTIITE